MAVSKYTLQSALAFLAITRSTRGLHINTRIAMHGYYELEEYQVSYGSDSEPLTLHRYKLNEAGWELAKKSRLWKAHQELVDLGFKIDSGINDRHTPRYIHYSRWLDDQERSITAFTGAHGRTYAQQPDATEKRWEHKMLTKHLNG
jgi:hypothetical protein